MSYVSGAGNGATITPNVGDTGKTLFFPNSGIRYTTGVDNYYGSRGYYWSANQNPSDTLYAWRLYFSGSVYTSGIISRNPKLDAYSIRCVRS